VMKQKAEQEKRMHEAIHTEIQEKRLKGNFWCINIYHEMKYVGFGKLGREEGKHWRYSYTASVRLEFG
jgi:hypothetical protein